MKASPQAKKVAFFDIDGTVFRSSLIVELVQELINEGVFPKSAQNGFTVQLKNWVDRKDTYEKFINALVKIFIKNLKGVSYEEFLRASNLVVDKHKNKVYRYTRDLVAELKKKKYFLLAISQSPKGTLDSFCKHIGFDKVYGRIYDLGPQGRFTGGMIDEHLIQNKAYIVRRAIEKENLTLENSYAVGDTENDIPMLELVENPICFNPNLNLYKHAKRNSWKIVVERKDVIYHIN